MLKKAIPIASLLTTLIIGAINVSILPPYALWIGVAAFVIVACAFSWPGVHKLLGAFRSSRTRRRVRVQYRDQIAALRKALEPLCSPQFVLSVGSILNRQDSYKLLGAGCVAAYQVSLSALYDQIRDLEKLAPHVSDAEAMARLHAWLQTYIRICDGVSDGLKPGVGAEVPIEQKSALSREWQRVCEQANAMRNEYQRLAYGIRGIDGRASVPEYLPHLASFS